MNPAAGAAAGVDLLETWPDAEWNAFVRSHPQGSVFHLSEWGAVYADLPWVEPVLLRARAGTETVGIMPLALVTWAPGRRALVSAPYCVTAGALARDDATRELLEAQAERLAHERRAASLEVRQSAGLNSSWPVHEGSDGFARALEPDVEANFAAIPRKQRAVVRKGIAAGLEAYALENEAVFYDLFATSMRNLGTPVYARRLFTVLSRHLGAHVHTLGVRHGRRTVAAVMSFRYAGAELPYYAGALDEARDVHAHDFMYWALMRRAVEAGCTRFDFGRSQRGSGAWSFKRHWGFEPEPLVYQFAPVDGPVAILDPDSPFNRRARAAWRRLPLAVANALGPLIARRLY